MQEAVLFQRVVSLVRSLAIELVANIRQNRADTSSYIECMLQKIMNWMLAKRGFRPPVKGAWTPSLAGIFASALTSKRIVQFGKIT